MSVDYLNNKNYLTSTMFININSTISIMWSTKSSDQLPITPLISLADDKSGFLKIKFKHWIQIFFKLYYLK